MRVQPCPVELVALVTAHLEVLDPETMTGKLTGDPFLRLRHLVGRKLKKPGVVKVSCDAHLWMRSTLYVTSHPYTAITGAEGSFQIQGLPPGTHTLKVWHEVLGEKEVPVTIEPLAKTTADLSF